MARDVLTEERGQAAPLLRLAQDNAHPRDALIDFFDDRGQHEYVIYEWHAGRRRAVDGNCRERGGTS